MPWKWIWKTVIAVCSVLFTAAATAWINAELEGHDLKGIPGIIQFWQKVARSPIPVWETALIVCVSVAGLVIGFFIWQRHAKKKVDLRITVLNSPPPRWHVGARAREPFIAITFRAQLAHQANHSLRITECYLEGTTCMTLFSPVVVTGPYDEPQAIYCAVQPVFAKDGQPISRRIVLVDQFGNTHKTKKRVRFEPGHHDATQFSHGGNPIVCWFCQQTIALEEFSESSSVPAHKACIMR